MNISERVAKRWVASLPKVADFPVGHTLEINNWRVHRYANSVHATDLTFAGKRGKKVPTLVLMEKGKHVPMEGFAMEVLLWARRSAPFARMKQAYDEFQEVMSESVDVYVRQERGVDVMPAGFAPVEVIGKHVSVSVTNREFTIKNLDDTDNESTCIPAVAGDLKSIPAFYRWVKDNEGTIRNMTFRDVLDQMHELGIKGHEYCAMD